jgi:hypothetical protein
MTISPNVSGAGPDEPNPIFETGATPPSPASAPKMAMLGSTYQSLAATATQLGIDFPIDPSNPSLDISIPRNADGTVNVQAMVEKLRVMLKYASTYDPMNFNLISNISAYMVNIAGVWGELSPTSQNIVQTLMGSPIVLAGSQTTLGAFLAQGLSEGMFYLTNGDREKTYKFINLLYTTINPLANTSPWLTDLRDHLASVMQDLPAWMVDHTKAGGGADMTFPEFLFKNGLRWEGLLLNDSTMTSFFSAWRKRQIDTIMGSTKDPFLLYMQLVMLLFGTNDDRQMQVGGVGKTIDALSKMGGKISEALNLFRSKQAGAPWTAADAIAFYQQIDTLQSLSKDARFASIQPQLKQVCDWFMSNLTNTSGLSIGLLYKSWKGYPDTDPQKAVVAEQISSSLNSILPSGSTIFTQYTTSLSNLQTGVTAVTNGSQVMAQTVQFMEGLSEKELAMLSGSLSSWTDVTKFSVQVQSRQ